MLNIGILVDKSNFLKEKDLQCRR